MYLLLFFLLFLSFCPITPHRPVTYRQTLMAMLESMPDKSHNPRTWNLWMHRFRREHRIFHRHFVRSL